MRALARAAGPLGRTEFEDEEAQAVGLAEGQLRLVPSEARQHLTRSKWWSKTVVKLVKGRGLGQTLVEGGSASCPKRASTWPKGAGQVQLVKWIKRH